MENNAPQKKQLPAFLILTIIAVVAAVVLALTNMVTAGPIAEHAMAALKEAFNAVMPAESFEEMTVPADYEVSSLYAAKNGDEVIGYCVTASGTGYGGPVAVTLGVDTNGVVTGCSVGDTSFAETAGFGMRAKDAAFQDQFPGISAIDGGSFEALSGATVTSEAVRAATNKGLKCVAEVALGKNQNTPVTFGAPAEKPADTQAPAEGALTASAPGFNGADVGVNVTLNEDGTIATLTLDLSQQVPPVCDMCNDEAFLGQFIGKKGPFEGVDIVTGATYTSEGVINALNQLFAAEEAFASADTRTASAPGFNGADVGVTAVLNADGTIAELSFDMSQQLPPVCDMCDTEEFKAQFIGKKGPFEGIDVVTGATFTSNGIIAALNTIYAEEAPADEAPATVLAEGENASLAVKNDGAALVTPAEGYTGDVNVKVSVENGKVTAGEFVAPAAEEVKVEEAADATAAATAAATATTDEVKVEETAPAGETLTAVAPGFLDSDVGVSVTLNEDGTIATLTLDLSQQVPPVCDLCNDEAFLNQFIGKKGPFEGVDVVTGATFTSNGVIEAMNSLFAAEEAPAAEEAAPAAETLTATAPGFVEKDVGVSVTLNEDGTIATLTLDLSQQVPPVCDLCNDEAFLNQFIGKKGPFEGVDVVTGATFTSNGVIEALNSLFAAEEAPAAEEAAPAAETLTATAPGFVEKDVGVSVTLNEDGTIATLTLDLSQQVPPVCDLCNDEAFLNQFIGKKGPFEGVDVVTGATFTSNGVIEALNSLFQ